MSQRNRVARVAGMNMNYPGQQPAGSSYYAASGAPGVTAGPGTGFSVAFSIRTPHNIADPLGTPWIDPAAEGAAIGDPGVALPQTEYIGGASDTLAGTGWAVAVQPGMLAVLCGDSDVALNTEERGGEMIGLFSFIPDASEYDGGAVTRMVLSVNGLLESSAALDGLVYAPSGTPFSIGGGDDPSFAADPEMFGGAVRTHISSMWVTEGIPTLDEASRFFETSMDAGIVIPQTWALARTPDEPNPETPDAPTGNYWTADGIKLQEGLGSVWADKIGTADLTRVSPGANPVEGDVAVSARQPSFAYIV